MNIYLISVWVSSSIMLLGTIWYCYLIIKNRVTPPLTTFIVASITFAIAIFMYSKKPGFSLLTNIGLTSSCVSTILVLITLLVNLKGKNYLFSSVQKFCLGLSGVIVAVWFITDNAFISYTLLQLNAVIAYIPVVEKNWKADKLQDSFVLWGSIFFSSLVASYAAYERNDIEAWIYIIRAVPSTLLVIILMVRVKNREIASR